MCVYAGSLNLHFPGDKRGEKAEKRKTGDKRRGGKGRTLMRVEEDWEKGEYILKSEGEGRRVEVRANELQEGRGGGRRTEEKGVDRKTAWRWEELKGRRRGGKLKEEGRGKELKRGKWI